MSFPRYPEYKDSGVEWLGEVPGHWSLRPLWSLFRRTKRTGFENEQLLSVYRDHGVVPKASRDDNNNKPSDDLSTYQLVDVGDLAINKMKAWQGSVAVSEHRGIVSPAYFVYEGTHSEDGRYLHHLMRSPRYVGACHALSKGIRVNQWDLDPTYHSRLPVLLPPKAEQACIAAFLDRETAKIDALVAEQQNLIALLKEKRQALISHAVTKGLDPDVPMKDSGVAWLGEVPAHWTLTKLKYSTSHIIDCPHETPTYCPDGDYLVVRTADVDAGALDLSNAYRLDEVEYLKRTRRAKLVPQDIVYGREGERWGYAATVPDEPVLCLGQRMMQFRARAGIAPRFLMWQLNSDVTYRQGQVDTVGATSPHVNVSTIANYVLTEPPFSEQVEIANYVDGATSEIDDLVSEARATVELLQERRTALISAAVTGKIDVRRLAAATSEPTPEPA